jgi:hypothetical protein
MEKYSSKVRPLPFEKWDNEKFVVRFHVEELPDEDGGVKYEYNEVLVPEVEKGIIINAIMRTKYTESDEIALAFGREKDAAKLAEHEAFKEQAEAWAEEILAE